MAQYRFFEDSGHGWLEVPYKELVQLGIEREISTCSYRNGNYVYLEEDCDMQIFANAYKGQCLNTISLYYDGECFIRDFDYYEKPLKIVTLSPTLDK